MTETIVLDAAGIAAAGRTELDITAWIAAAGPDWGDAAITAAMADMAIGSAPVDYRIPNRNVRIPLSLRKVGSTTFTTIRTNLQAKAALFQREGGWLMRKIGTVPYYADVVSATLHLGGSWMQAYRDGDTDAWLELECLPDWYGDEVTLSDHSTTTAAELIFTEPTVNGSYPGRVRLVVDNDQATDQHGLLWGFRSRNYSGSATAALAYEAEALTPLDAGTRVAHAGASGGTTLKHPSLPAGAWCPVMSTNIGGTAFLTHQGSYRVWGRCYSGTATPQLKFLWDVGDLTNPQENDITQIPTAGNFHILDFGQLRLDPAPVGVHRWQGVIQAKTEVQGDQVEIDRLWFQPLDESAGKLVAVQSDSPYGISYTAHPGTATDDASNGGGTAWLYPDRVRVENDFQNAYAYGPVGSTVITHYLRATNFGLNLPASAPVSGIEVYIQKQMQNTETVTDSRVGLIDQTGAVLPQNKAKPGPWATSNTLYVYGSPSDTWGGAWTGANVNDPDFGVVLSASINVVNPAGNRAFVDAIWIKVYYTTTGGFTTTADAVAFASRALVLRTEGAYRLDSGGVAYGPVSWVEGDLPRLPVSGSEGRTVETFIKMSRGDFASEADAGIDDISARIYYRPAYLYLG